MAIIPESLEREYDDLHQQDLVQGTQAGGSTAAAAKKVAPLHPHVVREEELALPPLGLLAALVCGEAPIDTSSILAMKQRLRTEMPRMLAERQAILGALR